MEMKHVTELVPNQNHVIINFNKIISETYISERCSSEDKKRIPKKVMNVYNAILNIYGITDVMINKFEVRITKGECFMWSNILPIVLNIINSELYHNEENTPAILPAGYMCFSFVVRYNGPFIDGFIDDAKFARSKHYDQDI